MRSCPHHISAWLSEEDYRHVKRQMQVSGKSASDLIRDLLRGLEVKPRPTQDTAELLRQISAVGNNINQIAHTANATRSVSSAQLDEVRRLLEEIWSLCLERF